MRRVAARLGLGALLALACVSAVRAQALAEPLPARRDPLKPKAAPRTPERASAARPCPEYGPGFVRIEGSSVCARIGGSVRVEYGKSSYRRYGSRADALVRFETRAPTSFGEVRTVLQGRVATGRGLSGSPYR